MPRKNSNAQSRQQGSKNPRHSNRQSGQQRRKGRRSNETHEALHRQADLDIAALEAAEAKKVKGRDTSPIVPRNATQKRYAQGIGRAPITIGNGPAGVGKTWLVAALAAEMLEAGDIDKILLTRPAQEAGEKLGFLPGEKEEKYEPYLQPFREALEERLGKTVLEYYLKVGKVEAAPLAYMRGRTFKNCLMILDEAQNTTPVQMKMFLTRAGEGSRIVVNGDLDQKDIHGPSGLQHAIKKLRHIAVVADFGVKDVVLEAWDAPDLPHNDLEDNVKGDQ